MIFFHSWSVPNFFNRIIKVSRFLRRLSCRSVRIERRREPGDIARRKKERKKLYLHIYLVIDTNRSRSSSSLHRVCACMCVCVCESVRLFFPFETARASIVFFFIYICIIFPFELYTYRRVASFLPGGVRKKRENGQSFVSSLLCSISNCQRYKAKQLCS